MLRLERTTSHSNDLQELVRLLDRELRSTNGDVQDVLDQYNIITDSFNVIIAYYGNIPVGCGCFKEFDADTVEIKRMFVLKDHRGKGVAAAIINGLEAWAKELNYTHAVLETGTRLVGAVKLYNKMGYTVRAQYGQYVDIENSVCMEKTLAPIQIPIKSNAS